MHDLIFGRRSHRRPPFSFYVAARRSGRFAHQSSTGPTGKYQRPRITLPTGKSSVGSLRQRHHVTALTSPQSFRTLGAGSHPVLPGAARSGSPSAGFGSRPAFVGVGLFFCFRISRLAECSTVREMIEGQHATERRFRDKKNPLSLTSELLTVSIFYAPPTRGELCFPKYRIDPARPAQRHRSLDFP